MQTLLMILLALHVVSTIFWAGTTIVVARFANDAAGRLMRPQWSAAVVAIITGGWLGHTVHNAIGPVEKVLMVGVASGLVAFTVQTTLFVRRLRVQRIEGADVAIGADYIKWQRISGFFLMIAALLMGASKYA